MADDKRISELPLATTPLTGTEEQEIIQGGVNKRVAVSNVGGSGAAATETTAGIAELATQAETNTGTDDARIVTPLKLANQNFLAPLASPALTGTPTAPTPSGGANDTSIATTAFVQGEIASKVDEETFATLTFASPTVWNTNSRQSPLAKVTATGNFTIDMTNVKDGASGVLKIVASTASAFTLTFDTDFTNRDLDTGATLTTWTFPANNGFHYINTFIVDGTTIYWKMGDVLNASDANPWAYVSAATLSVGNNDTTVAFPFTENTDNANIWDAGNPTRLTIPGSGNKIATITVHANFATNTTGVRRIRVAVNGSLIGNHTMIQQAPVTGITTQLFATFQYECVGGDYFEIIPYQNSGGSLDTTGSAKIKVENR